MSNCSARLNLCSQKPLAYSPAAELVQRFLGSRGHGEKLRSGYSIGSVPDGSQVCPDTRILRKSVLEHSARPGTLESSAVKRSGQSRRILYIQYTEPCGYPPLLHSAEILAGRGWEVLFLGTQALELQSCIPPDLPKVRFQYLRYCPPGWRQKLHYMRFCFWCVFWTLRWSPAWIYASDVPSCIPALMAHLLCRTKILYHEHDEPAGASNGFISSLLSRAFLWARRKASHVGEVCVIPNENRANAFKLQTATSREVKVVWNTPLRNEVSSPKPRPQGSLKLLYHGSINSTRLPNTVIHAIKRVGYPVVLRVVGYETIGSRGYTAELQGLAASLGIPECLEFVGFLRGRSDLIEHCRSCDIGLALLPRSARDPNLIDMFGASNKVFDYLACGLALLVGEAPGWQESLLYGLACDPADDASIARALRYFCEHPAEMRAMGERGRQRILDQWNYETHFAPVLELIET
jgi:glycosyltransferase involved in cell wall biosynthesis